MKARTFLPHRWRWSRLRLSGIPMATAEYIQAYVDGIPYYTFRNDGSSDPQSWPFDKPFNIKLNIAVGGSWGGYMGIDDSIFPAEYIIDYVRVYQR